MSLAASFSKHRLNFKFEAGTSRGILKSKDSYFLKVWDDQNPHCTGLGEAGPLKGLSPDYGQVSGYMKDLCSLIGSFKIPACHEEIWGLVDQIVSPEAPSVRFALECALIDLINGGQKILFEGNFTKGKQTVPINGLVWMGSFEFMKEQVDRKIAEGYQCIKIKIGAIDFDQECALLDYIRTNYRADISLRVDANGAFTAENITTKLSVLAPFNLHSIEQPVMPGQMELIKKICAISPVPIAFDEELIGVNQPGERQKLLSYAQPQFIVLKPTLLGGLKAASDWIGLAEDLGIGWWITSALESNVGLNALAQFTANANPGIAQGLGTGKLFHNNVPPDHLVLEAGYMKYQR